MKVTCVQENLHKALSHASRIISAKNTLPILDNILLSTDKGRLKISSTDLELGINYWIGAKIEEDGSVAVPSRLITEFIAAIRDEKITITANNTDVLVEGNTYNAKIKGMEGGDFPPIPDISDNHLFSISAKTLIGAIPQVLFAAAADTMRPQLMGVFFKLEKDSLKMVATDSYRLAEKNVKVSKTTRSPESFIVPARTIAEAGKLIKDAGDTIEVCFRDNQVLFNFGAIHLTSRLIDGQYPNHEQIIPQDFETDIVVEKDELLNVCRVASLFARASANSIKIIVKPDKGSSDKGTLTITGQGVEVGESTSRIPVKMKGKEIDIAFNVKYILDALPNIAEKNIVIRFAGKINPGIIRGEGKDEYTYVIMPLRA